MCTARTTGILKKEGRGRAGSQGRRDLAEPGRQGKTWMSREDARAEKGFQENIGLP